MTDASAEKDSGSALRIVCKVPAEFKRGLERILAARERLLEVRGERIGQLMRLRLYLRTILSEFMEKTDPIGGMRLVEVQAEGNKTKGEGALSLTFFDGSRLRVEVDKGGTFSQNAEPDVFKGVGKILSIRVRPDLSGADFDYMPIGAGEKAEVKTAEFSPYVAALLDHVVAEMEAQAGGPADAAQPSGETARKGYTYSVR
jgi:hypothetical protein